MRKSGIEILRAIAMLMVVTLHVVGAGGILQTVEPFSKNYFIAWFLEIVSLCAVNCFGLISGWLLCNKKADFRRWIKFAAQVTFYTLAVWGITRVLGWHQASIGLMLKSSLPHNTPLWYVKSYLLLLFLTPVLNAFIEQIDEGKLKWYLGGSILLFSVLPTLAAKDIFCFQNGYNVWWLAVLYVWGGLLRKLKADETIKAWKLLMLLAVVETAACLSKMLVEYLQYKKTGEYSAYAGWIGYTSPLIVAEAVCLLLLCLKIKAGWMNRKYIRLLFESVFGIYLIHMNYVVNGRMITNKYLAYGTLRTRLLLFYTVMRIGKIFFVSWAGSVLLMFMFKNLYDFFADRIAKRIGSKK